LELFHHGLKGFQVLEEVCVVEMATLQVLEGCGKASRNDSRHEGIAVGRKEVCEGSEENSSGLFLGRNTKKGGVEDNDVVLPGRWLTRSQEG
jgi:hypothetical protein